MSVTSKLAVLVAVLTLLLVAELAVFHSSPVVWLMALGAWWIGGTSLFWTFTRRWPPR